MSERASQHFTPLRITYYILILGCIMGMAFYEWGGLKRELFTPVEAAILAFIPALLFAVACHFSLLTRWITPRFFVGVLLLLGAWQFGLSFAEHAKHEKGGAARHNTELADHKAAQTRLTNAQAQLREIDAEIQPLLAEIGAMQAARDEVDRLAAQIIELKARHQEMNSDGKRENDYLLPGIEAEQIALQNAIDSTAVPTIGEIAAAEARLRNYRDRYAQRESDIAQLEVTVNAEEADALQTAGMMHPIFSLSNRLTGNDEDYAQVARIVLGMVWGGIILACLGWATGIPILYDRWAAKQARKEERQAAKQNLDVRYGSSMSDSSDQSDESDETRIAARAPETLPDNVHPFPEPDDRPERDPAGMGELFDLEELIHDSAPISTTATDGRTYEPPGEGYPPRMRSDVARWWLRTFNTADRLPKRFNDAEIQAMSADKRRELVEQVFAEQGIKIQPVAA